MTDPSTATRPPVLLVVDDETDIRETLARISARVVANVDVVTAGSATEATAVIRRQAVDAVLTDVRMPGGSGVSLIQSIRSQAPGIRCALMTGYHEDVIDGVTLSTLGLVGVLRKPFRVSDAGDLLRALLSDAPRAAHAAEPDVSGGRPSRGMGAAGGVTRRGE